MLPPIGQGRSNRVLGLATLRLAGANPKMTSCPPGERRRAAAAVGLHKRLGTCRVRDGERRSFGSRHAQPSRPARREGHPSATSWERTTDLPMADADGPHSSHIPSSRRLGILGLVATSGSWVDGHAELGWTYWRTCSWALILARTPDEKMNDATAYQRDYRLRPERCGESPGQGVVVPEIR